MSRKIGVHIAELIEIKRNKIFRYFSVDSLFIFSNIYFIRDKQTDLG